MLKDGSIDINQQLLEDIKVCDDTWMHNIDKKGNF